MAPIGGGALRNITHRHFLFVFLTFLIIVGSIWFWHRLKIRAAVQAERAQYMQFQAEQNAGNISQKRIISKPPIISR